MKLKKCHLISIRNKKHWPEKAKLSYIPHIEFDEEIKKVKAVIRTGGYWLHAPNVILQAGCTYDE